MNSVSYIFIRGVNMELTQRMPNTLPIEVENLDLTQVEDPVVIIDQVGNFHVRKVPAIVSSSEMYVTLTFEESMKLNARDCRIQFAWTLDGIENATDPQFISVREFIDKDGYHGTN